MIHGHFMEALMDFSVSIKLEKDRLHAQAEREKQSGGPMIGERKKDNLQEYYRNAGQANYELA